MTAAEKSFTGSIQKIRLARYRGDEIEMCEPGVGWVGCRPPEGINCNPGPDYGPDCKPRRHDYTLD